MKAKRTTVALAFGFFLASSVQAAFLLEIDTDGADDGVLTYNPGFSFGGDTTIASQSALSSAYGMNGGDSIFGGNGSILLDTYVYTYSPDSEADNLAIPPGTDLGNGVLATGALGGGPGIYNIYATWPYTENVSGGLTTYTADTLGDLNNVAAIDQNFTGNLWVLLGSIDYISGPIIVTQEAGLNTFVSMRAAGLLFEFASRESAIPEPASLSLLGLGALALLRRRKH